MSEKIIRSVLRYHGGKWRIGKWIISYFPSHHVYVEPFGGAASVLLQKPRSFGEVYNDLDGEIVNVFRVIQNKKSALELERLIRLTPFARDEFQLSYEFSDDPVEQARRTIIRAYFGFGSDGCTRKYRTGFRSRKHLNTFSSPAIDWMRYPDYIGLFTERLQGVVIENKDAFELIHDNDKPNTLFYIDPPYLHSTRGNGSTSHGYKHELTDDDHKRLASVIHELEGMVILSGYDSDLYNHLYSGWMKKSKDVFADGLAQRTEVIWISPKVCDMYEPLFRTEKLIL